jgi:hypothetical protein
MALGSTARAEEMLTIEPPFCACMFPNRLSELKLGHLCIIPPMLIWGETLWNQGDFVGPEEQKLASDIESILFPEKTVDEVEARNRLCDVQAIWAHIWNKRDVRVTRSFTRRPRSLPNPN